MPRRALANRCGKNEEEELQQVARDMGFRLAHHRNSPRTWYLVTTRTPSPDIVVRDRTLDQIADFLFSRSAEVS